MKKNTSWDKSAGWYDDAVEREGSYQKELILPNLLRLAEIKNSETILDLACGQGFFARAFAQFGAQVIGVDVAKNLIAAARKHGSTPLTTSLAKNIEYYAAPADKLDFLKPNSIDKVVIVLALQNIEDVQAVLKECARVLKNSGRLFLVLNHPAFRVLKRSSWGWSEEEKIQYRRLDAYLSESIEKIQMHPGDQPSEYTFSFHRPLQFYFKALNKSNFAITKLEEWNSHKKSQPGPRARAENLARQEIPLFLFLEARLSH